MFRRERIGGFVLRLLLLYGLLVIPWPGLQEGYSTLFRAAGNAIFGSFGSEGLVRFRSAPDGGEGMDVEMRLQKRGGQKFLKVPTNARMLGYLPTAEMIALILATPILWSRRWKALLWGLILVNGFVMLRVAITLVYWFSVDGPCALYFPNVFWNNVLAGLFTYVAIAPSCSFLVPALIWMLVSFRGSDWAEAIGQPAREAT